MTTRGKFQLQEVRTNAWSPTTRTFVFRAVCNDGTPENERFHKYTPSGELVITVDNSAVVEGIKLGEFFYLDISSVQVDAPA